MTTLNFGAAGPGGAALLIEWGAIVVVLAVGGRLSLRWHLSPIPIYLLVGLAIGDGGFVDIVAARPFIESSAQIGIVMLLLMLGLEFSAGELMGSLRRSAASGAIDFVLNFAPGAVFALLMGWGPSAALLIGGVTYISSSGIVAKLLDDFGRTGNRETPVVLSILLIEDLTMALYLPVLAGVLAGGAPAQVMLDVVVALSAVVGVLVLAVRFGPAMSRWVFSRSDEMLVLTIVGIALAVSGLADHLQASAAVGALVVGIALSGPAADHARPVLAPLRDVFAAVFFVYFGLETDPASLPLVAAPAIVLAAIGVLTKLATGWWSGARAGIGRAGRWRAGAVLVARGEFSIVIAGLGVIAGVDAEVAAVAVTYVLLLAVLGPLLARFPGRPAARQPKS